MSSPLETNSTASTLEKELSRYWFCPNDQNLLQIRQSRVAQNPYFSISRGKVAMGVKNAIAMKKIPHEIDDYTKRMVNLIFEKGRSLKVVELVSVTCKQCGRWLAAPRVSKVDKIHLWGSILKESPSSAYTVRYSRVCPQCQNQVENSYKFCIHCGTRIQGWEDHLGGKLSSSKEETCSHCKKVITKSYTIRGGRRGIRFCSIECREEYSQNSRKI